VQYAQVYACSAFAARSSASSGISNVRISASVSAKSFALLSMAPARAAIARAMIPMPIRLDPAFLRQRFVLIGQADRGQRDEAAGLVAQAQ